MFNNVPSDLSDKSLTPLAAGISSSWVSFIATLNPNPWRNGTNASAISVTLTWPRYVYGNAREMVFEGGGKSHVEGDDWRSTQVSLINGPSGIAVAYQRMILLLQVLVLARRCWNIYMKSTFVDSCTSCGFSL